MLVSKRRSLVSKKGKNTSQTGKQFRKYFYCFCLAEALLAEAEVQKTPVKITISDRSTHVIFIKTKVPFKKSSLLNEKSFLHRRSVVVAKVIIKSLGYQTRQSTILLHITFSFTID